MESVGKLWSSVIIFEYASVHAGSILLKFPITGYFQENSFKKERESPWNAVRIFIINFFLNCPRTFEKARLLETLRENFAIWTTPESQTRLTRDCTTVSAYPKISSEKVLIALLLSPSQA